MSVIIKKSLAIVLTLLMMVSLCTIGVKPVFANTILTVDKNVEVSDSNYQTLEAAVSAAKAGDVVEIKEAGTYKVPGISKNITIKGGVNGVIFDCVGSGSIASVPNGATFENVEFNMGSSNYHGFQHAGTINMVNCTFNGLFFSYGDMNFTDCTFNQTASEYAMWDYGQNLTYTNCTFNCNGKFVNVYNEGNGNWKLTAENCTFNSTKKNKAAFNIKASCGATNLGWDVTIKNCVANGDNWPDKSGDATSTLVVIDPLVQVDDRTPSAIEANIIKVNLNGKQVYPSFPHIDLDVETDEIKGITEEIVNVISNNTIVSKQTAVDTGLTEALKEIEGADEAVLKIQLVEYKKDANSLTFEIAPYIGKNKVANDDINDTVTFKVPLTNDFTTYYARVDHEGEISYQEVKENSGNKYIELSVTHFSEFNITPASEKKVAVIGETEYATLKEALDAVKNLEDNDVTIKVLGDISEAITDTYKFNKNVTITSDNQVKIDFVDQSNSCYLMPNSGKTLTIGKNITIDNLFSIGADKTNGTTIINGVVGATWFRAYGEKNSADHATLIINGTAKKGTTSGGEHWIRISQHSDVEINGTVESLGISAGGLIEGKTTVNNTQNCSFLKNTDTPDGALHFVIKNSKVVFDKADYPDMKVTGSLSMDATSELVVGNDFIVNAGKTVSIVPGAKISANSITNNGTISVDLTNAKNKVKVIDFTGNGNVNYGTVVSQGSADFTTSVEDKDLYIQLAAEVVAKLTHNSIDTNYTDLEEAINAAQDRDRVILLTDAEVSKTISILSTSNLTLDLAGKRITSNGWILENHGNLMVIDSVGNGEMSARGCVDNYGTLTLVSGKLTAKDNDGGAAVWNNAEGIFRMSGGELFVKESDSNGLDTVPHSLVNEGKTSIASGTISSLNNRGYAIKNNSGEIEITQAENKNITVSGTHGGLAVDGGTATINGGSFSSTNYYGLYVSNDQSKSTVTVNAGQFDGKTISVYIGSDIKSTVDSALTIKGGVFKKAIKASEKVISKGLQVTGGTFPSEVPEEYCAANFVSIKNANGTYDVVKAPVLYDDEKVTIKDESEKVSNDAYSEIQKIKNEIKDNAVVNDVGSTNIQNIMGDDKAQISIKLTSMNINLDTTTITNKITYEVKPIDGNGTPITNNQISEKLSNSNDAITFRLAVPSSMTGSGVLVSHIPDGATTSDWSKVYVVHGEDTQRYIELSVKEFSSFELTRMAEQPKEDKDPQNKTSSSGTTETTYVYKAPNTSVRASTSAVSITKSIEIGAVALSSSVGLISVKKKED